jgi:hypothetical protein
MSRNSTVASIQTPRLREDDPNFKTATPSLIIFTSSTSTSNSVTMASEFDLSDQHMAEFEAGVRKNFTAAEINYLSYLLRAQRLHQESAHHSTARHGASARPNEPATACSGQSSNQPNALYEFPSVFGTVPPPPPQNLKPPYTPDPSLRKRKSHQEEPESPSEAVSPALTSPSCSDILFPCNQLANKALKRLKAQSPRPNGVHVSGSSSARRQAPSVENEDSQQHQQLQDPAPSQGQRTARLTVVSKSATSAKLTAAAPKTTSTLFISPATPFNGSQSNRSRSAKDNSPSAQLAAAFHAQQELYAMLKDSPPACPNAVASTSARSAEFIAPVTPPKASKKVAVPALQPFPAPPEPWASRQQTISPPSRCQVPSSQLYSTIPSQTSASHRPFVSPRIQPHEMPAFASHEFLAGFPTGNLDDPFVAGKGKQKALYSTAYAQPQGHPPNASASTSTASAGACLFSGKVKASSSTLSLTRQTVAPPKPLLSHRPLPDRQTLSKVGSSDGVNFVMPDTPAQQKRPRSSRQPGADVLPSGFNATWTPSPMQQQYRIPTSPLEVLEVSGRLALSESPRNYQDPNTLPSNIGAFLPATPERQHCQTSGHYPRRSLGHLSPSPFLRPFRNTGVLRSNPGAMLTPSPTQQRYHPARQTPGTISGNLTPSPSPHQYQLPLPLPDGSASSVAFLQGHIVTSPLPIGEASSGRETSSCLSKTPLAPNPCLMNPSTRPKATRETCPPPEPVRRATHRRDTSSGSSSASLLIPHIGNNHFMSPDACQEPFLSPDMGSTFAFPTFRQELPQFANLANGEAGNASSFSVDLIVPELYDPVPLQIPRSESRHSGRHALDRDTSFPSNSTLHLPVLGDRLASVPDIQQEPSNPGWMTDYLAAHHTANQYLRQASQISHT